jgi:hypothetical protein
MGAYDCWKLGHMLKPALIVSTFLINSHLMKSLVTRDCHENQAMLQIKVLSFPAVVKHLPAHHSSHASTLAARESETVVFVVICFKIFQFLKNRKASYKSVDIF